MQDEFFAKTSDLRLKLEIILRTVDEVKKTLSEDKNNWEEVDKLTNVLKMLKEFDWNLEELEHLVIVDGVHYRDSI